MKIETKVCTSCKTEKPLSEFPKRSKSKDGYYSWCKECSKARNKESYLRNKQARLEYYKKYRSEHYDEYIERGRKYTAENREILNEKKRERYWENREKNIEVSRKYRETHKEARKEYESKNRRHISTVAFERQKKRRLTDKTYDAIVRLRSNLNTAIKRQGYTKKSEATEILGAPWDVVIAHLNRTWKERYGTEYNGQPVHIDHIIPLKTAKTEEDVIRLCHYTNLQYLTPEDNMRKHDKEENTGIRLDEKKE